MKLQSLLLGLAAAHGVFGGEMERLMALKIQQRIEQRAAGLFDPQIQLASQAPGQRPCLNGKAGEYSCRNIDLIAQRSHAALGSKTNEGNDIWGWTAPNGREFAAVGQTDGTAFVEILNDGSIVYVGRLPTQTTSEIWRDMKVINGYCYIGSEAVAHGLQIFNMRKLLNVPNKPKTFSILTDQTAWYAGFGSSHNIVANEATNMIYAVGTTRELPCAGGLFMVNVTDPRNPTSPGCVSQDGYVHDAQCVIYKGPHKRYRGREICFNYNEDTLTIVDVTNKRNPVQLSRTPYRGAAYTHQGWVTDMNDMSYLLLDDELDELDGTNPGLQNHTTTYIWDIRNLNKPVNTGIYQSPVKSIDHNQYVVNGISYQSNYGSGLRMVDVRSVRAQPNGKGFREIGFFDVHPEDDAQGGVVEFFGSWSVWPYGKKGYILVNSIERGLFVLKYRPGK